MAYASRAGAQTKCIPYLVVAPVSCKCWLGRILSDLQYVPLGIVSIAEAFEFENGVHVVFMEQSHGRQCLVEPPHSRHVGNEYNGAWLGQK